MRQLVIIFALAFVAGAAIMVALRGPAPEEPAAGAAPQQHDEHAVAREPHAGHEHAGHEHDEHSGPAPESPGMVTVHFCRQDESYAVSYPAPCPLDGEPMVAREVERSRFEDLENPVCPICDMEGREDLFAIYKGTLVRFGCKACDKPFFEDPEKFIREAKAQSQAQQ